MLCASLAKMGFTLLHIYFVAHIMQCGQIMTVCKQLNVKSAKFQTGEKLVVTKDDFTSPKMQMDSKYSTTGLHRYSVMGISTTHPLSCCFAQNPRSLLSAHQSRRLFPIVLAANCNVVKTRTGQILPFHHY